MPFSFYTWTVIAFLLVLGVYFYVDRKNFERQGITFLRKTQIGQTFINRMANKYPKFWRWYSNIAAVVAYPLMIGSFLLIAYLGIDFVFDDTAQAPVGLVLPSFTQDTVIGSGFFLVPFWYWIIAIFILAVVHEGAHGIIARNEKVKVKSLGFAFFGPIVAAFVEPDDNQMFNKGWKTVARIASVGAFTNFMFGALFFGAFFGFDAVAYNDGGVGFASIPGEPMNQTGIQGGVLLSLNDKTINNTDHLTEFLSDKSPGDTITAEVNATDFEGNWTLRAVDVTLSENPEDSERGFIGIGNVQTIKEAKAYASVSDFFRLLFYWLFLFNIFIGLANLIPAGPLDGGLIWKATMHDNFGDIGEKVVRGTNWTMGIVILMMFATLLIRDWIPGLF